MICEHHKVILNTQTENSLIKCCLKDFFVVATKIHIFLFLLITFGQNPPEAAGGVLEDGGPLGIAGLRVLVGLVLPTRVGNNNLVGQSLQAVVDDHHLQGFIGRQIPQGSWRGGKKKSEDILGG